jgi:pimeloyl-ACP methyl ester carboxylesterase
MSEPLVWRGFTQAALDAAYNNMAAVSDSQARLDGWAARSAVLRATKGGECGLRYGDAGRQEFDVFRCGAGDAPMVIFIHGGWWQRNSKEVFSCLALGPMALGCDVAMVGYTLAPEARLSDIVIEIKAAISGVAAHQASLGKDDSCILSGWSAGGHLAAAMLGHPAVRAGVSISGVFDLDPIRHSYINDRLRLDDGEAFRLSPANAGPSARSFLAFAGECELPELRRQTLEFAAGRENVEALMLPGHDHFSILEEMAAAGGAVAQALARLARRDRNSPAPTATRLVR